MKSLTRPVSTTYKNPHAGFITCEICGKRARSDKAETTTQISDPQLSGHFKCVLRVERDPKYLQQVRARRAREHQAHLLIKNYWNDAPAERAKRVQQARALVEIPEKPKD